MAAKLALAVLVLALVPLLATALFDARDVEAQATARETDALQKQAADAALRIGERVERLRAYAEVLASNPLLQEAVGSAAEVGGAEAAQAWEGDHPSVYPMLLSLQRANPWFEHVYLLNARGVCVATSQRLDKPDMLGRNYSFRPYYRVPTQTGEAFVSDVLKNATSAGTAIFVSAPVIVDGSTRAVAVVKVSSDALHEVVGELSRLDRRALFIDRFGVVVSEANDGEVSTPMEEGSLHFHPLAPVSERTRIQFRETQRYGDPEGENYLDRIAAPLHLAQLWGELERDEAGASEEELPVTVGGDTVQTVVGFAPVWSGENEPYGYLVVGEPSARFREPLQAIGRSALYRFVLVLIGVMLLMALAIRRLAGRSEASEATARAEARRAREQLERERRTRRALLRRLDELDPMRDAELLQVVAALDGAEVSVPIDTEEIEVEPVLEELVAATRGNASLGGNKVSVDAKNVGPVSTDRKRLLLLLRQLVDNAIANTRNGTIELHARRYGDDVVIEVRDTGMGLSPRQLDRHFSGPIELPAPHDGRLGIGVAVARELAQRLGAKLTAKSEPGEGTTVTVRLH